MKNITITLHKPLFIKNDWLFDFESDEFICFSNRLREELKRYNFQLAINKNLENIIEIKSYNDLLNCVKLSTDETLGNHCVGHCIGKSENLNIIEDIENAVKRVIFAPETIAPASEFRKVCHNCGCGC